MSEFPFFSTLPHHKINSACSGMSYHAANSRLVKKLDNKKKMIKMILNQQPGEIPEQQLQSFKKNWIISRKNIQIWSIFTDIRAKETASESGSCCTALFPQSNVCKI